METAQEEAPTLLTCEDSPLPLGHIEINGHCGLPLRIESSFLKKDVSRLNYEADEADDEREDGTDEDEDEEEGDTGEDEQDIRSTTLDRSQHKIQQHIILDKKYSSNGSITDSDSQTPIPFDLHFIRQDSDEFESAKDDGVCTSDTSTGPPTPSFSQWALPPIITKDNASPEFANEFFSVGQSAIANANFGAFAAKDLRRGDVILRERPLFTASNRTEILSEYRRLSHKNKEIAQSLHAHHRVKDGLCPIIAISDTNSFVTVPGRFGLFPISARFNHACNPINNVKFTYDPLLRCQVLTVCAHHVKLGEELTICYGETYTPTRLFYSYGFLCMCGAHEPLTVKEQKEIVDCEW